MTNTMEDIFALLTQDGKGTTKSILKEKCGRFWNEKYWRRMVRKSKIGIGNTPFFDHDTRQWFWYHD